MLKKSLYAGVLLSLFVFADAAAPQTKTIALGVISKRPLAEVEPQYRDFVRYVARKLSAPGRVEGKVVTAQTVYQLQKLLEQDKVDFYMESPYPTYLINRDGAAMPLLRRWKSGSPEYRSIFFAKKEGGARDIADLRGALIALEDPGSTSGYFLPKVFLAGKGMKLAEKTSLDAPVGPNEVGYIFAYSASKVADMVLTRRAAAGAFSNEDLDRLEPKKKADLIILGETENFPRYFVSVRKEMDPKAIDRLQEVLVSMHQDPEGRAILDKLENTTRFDAAPGGEQAVRFKLQEVFGLQ
jgi:phosphonate transport system substrate-binding protein